MALEGLQIRIVLAGPLREKVEAIRAQALPTMRRHFKSVMQDVFRASQGELSNRMLKTRTGHLKRSGYWELQGDGLTAEIGYTAPYARWLHEGTRPYTIVPKTARALRFQVGKRVVFAKRVRHPGLRGRPFLAGPLVAHRPLFVARLREGILQTLNEA
jgi:hypothetical protein